MTQIAVFVDKNGFTTNINEPGDLIVYNKINEQWVQKTKLPIALHEQADIRGFINDLTEKIKPCEIIVARKMIGIVYHLFDRLGFLIWDIEGNPENFLDEVLEESSTVEDDDSVKTTDDEGKILINLTLMQNEDPTKTSKQIIIPILEEKDFYELTILCSHIPPWMTNLEEKYNIKVETNQIEEGKYSLVVTNKVCNQ